MPGELEALEKTKIAGYPVIVVIPIIVGGVVVAYYLKRSMGGGGSTPQTVTTQEVRLPPVQAPGPGPSGGIIQPTPQPIGVLPTKNTPPAPPQLRPAPPVQIMPVMAHPPFSIEPLPAPRTPLPPPPPAQQHLSYPGLPSGFQMDCQNTYKGLLGDFDSVLNGQRSKGQSAIFTARNMATIAITGATTPWDYNGKNGGAVQYGIRNNIRVRWGLAPLMFAEWEQLRALSDTMIPAHKFEVENPAFKDLSYARAVFNQFNLPYQCGRSTIRR